MIQRPSIPKGTRDFSSSELEKRNFIFDTIKDVYCLYGFQPIETPAMENLSTLTGKYGAEGDQLLFKVLNSGNFLSKLSSETLQEREHSKILPLISEKGLRYDLTVPFARFVVQNRNNLVFPFRRYQIQPVWRADRPQKGRYREFYQCDADMIGSNSLLNELELIQIIDEVFNRLKMGVVIKINNRKILSGIAESIGELQRITDITVAIDKLDKIGLSAVNEELSEKGLSTTAIDSLQPVLTLEGSRETKITHLESILKESETGLKGLSEITEVLSYLSKVNLNSSVELDLTLARGLNYYTGIIIEVKSTEMEIGSICGGGRYDDLTGIFGLPGMSGVGISFGAERIYDVLEYTNGFPDELAHGTKVLFVNFGQREVEYCLPAVAELRRAGVKTEIYPDASKTKKQMSYADKKNIPFVVFAGESEIEKVCFTVKDMTTGEQQSVDIVKLISAISDK